MKRLFSFLLIILPFILTAQQDTCSYIVVSDIIIEGNNVTLSSIILKELTFSQGDTISIDDWEKELQISKENIQNTTLFNFVDIECVNTDNSQNGISVNIKVTERWYLWAYPYLSYADRNLNAWYEADNLKRFSYGFDGAIDICAKILNNFIFKLALGIIIPLIPFKMIFHIGIKIFFTSFFYNI